MEAILREHPLDAAAFRLAHFNNFWLGRPQDMVASVERVLPAWSEGHPGYAMILGCLCFAHEEKETISPPSRPGAAPSNSTLATCGPRMRSPMCWSRRAAAAKASTG
ncbi:MAG: hypothetical protein IPI73_25335 [Betaproteobacteria bacterium]|nr:hypothetical protein [Betaproteobacteria bacterium]